jgi:RNA polymerase sigma factor for flagellar operon FliA
MRREATAGAGRTGAVANRRRAGGKAAARSKSKNGTGKAASKSRTAARTRSASRTTQREVRPMEAEVLWEAYQGAGDEAARERLLARHLPLVHHVARQVMRTLTVEVELDELVSAGSMGLMNAIDSFDRSRGLAFSTYAAPRIRGAILDDLRRSDCVPRSIRRKQRQLAAATEELSGRLDRAPVDREVAQTLDIDIETLWRWRSDTNEAVQVSLDQPINTGPGRTAMPADLIEGSNGLEAEGDLNHSEEVSVLRDEIILSLYYFEELKLHEIAKVLGLTESRVSQIRSKALTTLRSRMARLREPGEC